MPQDLAPRPPLAPAVAPAVAPATPTTQRARASDDERTPLAKSFTSPQSQPQSQPQLPPKPAAPTPTKALPESTPEQLEDGPLFRACCLGLLSRAGTIKCAPATTSDTFSSKTVSADPVHSSASEKRILKLGEASLSAQTANCQAMGALDEELEHLCVSNLPAKLDSLGGLWVDELEKERKNNKARREAERERLEVMLNRMRDSVDRLRSLETRRKVFEAESKSYYSDVAKVSWLSLAVASWQTSGGC